MRVESVFAAIGQGVGHYGVRCGGGKPVDALSAVELSGLLSGLSAHELDFAYGLYGQDAAAQRRFLGYFVGAVGGFAMVGRGDDAVLVERLATLAAMSFFSPSVCYLCNGVGRSGMMLCMGCHGDGKAPFAVADKTRLLGISYFLWRKRYADLYAQAHNLVAGVDQRIRWFVAANQRRC